MSRKMKFQAILPKQVLGLILCSTGCGMLVVLIIPWWGFMAAMIMVIVGAVLLFSKKC